MNGPEELSGGAELNGSADLERAYRRLVACYPRSFRRENEEEIITVLLATAARGQRRPGLAESADLIRGAVRMRTGLHRTPRSVLRAVRLMYLGAFAELGVLCTVLLTEGSVRAAVIARNPHLSAAQLRSLGTVFTSDVVWACIGTALWIWLAWGNGKGHGLSRIAAIVVFALYTTALLCEFATNAAVYAPAAMVAASVVWLIGLASIVLLLRSDSGPYFERQPAR